MRRIGPLAALLLVGAAGPVPRCTAGAAELCGFDRPEDLAPLPGGWIAVSQTGAPSLLLVGPDGVSRRPVVVDGGSSSCPAPTALHTRGIDVRRVGGTVRLVAINQPRPGETRIELLSLRSGRRGPTAQWTGCVSVPARYQLNDVVLAPDGSLYASHMFDPADGPEALAERRRRFLARQPTGYAVRWTRATGWRKVPGSDRSFANGIALSADARTLAVAGTFDQGLVLVDVPSGRRRFVALPLQPDNISRHGRGFLVAGHTGIPVTGIDPCRDPASLPCGFPFAVVGVEGSRVTALFRHDGSRLPGASVAVAWRGRLALGSAYGDRVSLVARPTRPGGSDWAYTVTPAPSRGQARDDEDNDPRP